MVKQLSKLVAGDVVVGGDGKDMLRVSAVLKSRANTVILEGTWLAASERDGSRTQGRTTLYPTGFKGSQIVTVR